MRKWTDICILLLAAALLFAGCLGSKNPPVPTPATPTLFVDYQRTGGFAGVNDRLVIFDNGVALVSSRTTSREFTLNRSELESISAVFEEAQFPSLEGNYTSRRGGADLLQYSITYGGKTVNTEDTAIPAALEQVIGEMDRIMANGLNSGQAGIQLPAMAS